MTEEWYQNILWLLLYSMMYKFSFPPLLRVYMLSNLKSYAMNIKLCQTPNEKKRFSSKLMVLILVTVA